MAGLQPSLFGAVRGGPSSSLDERLGGVRRIALDDENWIDHHPGWGDDHERLFEHLCETTAWRAASREMDDRVIEVPRLLAGFPDDGPGHPLLRQTRGALERCYAPRLGPLTLDAVSAALYRNGDDSVALHGDTWARTLPMAMVAIVSVGAPRRLVIRPVEASAGRARSFSLAWGDLLVMGGACQRRWLHGVPMAKTADPRMSIMFRQRVDPYGGQPRRARRPGITGAGQ